MATDSVTTADIDVDPAVVTVDDGTPSDAPEATTGDFMSNPDVIAYIDQKIAEGVQNALKGKPPKANTTDPSATERAEFEKMSYRERVNLFNSDPHTYNKLTKGVN